MLTIFVTRHRVGERKADGRRKEHAGEIIYIFIIIKFSLRCFGEGKTHPLPAPPAFLVSPCPPGLGRLDDRGADNQGQREDSRQ